MSDRRKIKLILEREFGAHRRQKIQKNLPHLLHHREIYGDSRIVTKVICAISLADLDHNVEFYIEGTKKQFDLSRVAVFLGISPDSRYILAIISESRNRGLFTRREGENDSRIFLINEVANYRLHASFYSVHSYPSNATKVSAVFACDSSFVATISFNDGAVRAGIREPITVIAHISIISFKLFVQRLNAGIVVNGGEIVSASLFLREIISINLFPFVYRREVSSFIPSFQNITIREASAMYPARTYSLLSDCDSDKFSYDGSQEPLFLLTTHIHIEQIIYSILDKEETRENRNLKFIRLLDYEVDIVDAISSRVFILVRSLIICAMNKDDPLGKKCECRFEINWDVLNGVYETHWIGLQFLDGINTTWLPKILDLSENIKQSKLFTDLENCVSVRSIGDHETALRIFIPRSPFQSILH
ncbi:unnamed protein product [Dracunculus medinensis]|uniref:DCAF15_WD40 domain-containing protein n=1 Tax=Dracunculus medinensis TaxID=318479 RepID=A0A158Q4U9_DRAME|nr:unnamed protein product [Dracunculus medinensis]